MARPAPAWAAPLALACLWAAMGLLGGEGSALDVAIHARWRWGVAAPALLVALTDLGGWRSLMLISAGAVLALLALRRARAALLLAAVALSGRWLIEAQKAVTARVRPPAEDHLVGVESLSFPSGHSGNAMIVFLLIALLLARGRPWAVAVALLLAGAVGLSRVMLGVHWPSDVIGGWAFGAAWVLLWVGTARAAGWLEPRKEPPMTENKRTETARDTDDSDLIEGMEDAPSQSGAYGGNLQRDIGTRAEEQRSTGDPTGVTRVRDDDKPEEANLPRFNESN